MSTFLTPHSFKEHTALAVGYHSSDVRVIDLNQDGNLDIITLNKGTRSSAAPGTLSVLFGNGDGTFKTQAQYGISGKYFAMMAFGDFNNDGRTDIVISKQNRYCYFK